MLLALDARFAPPVMVEIRRIQQPTCWWLQLVGRLKPGVSIEQARAGSLSVVVVIVLLIVCANIASLLLTRATVRSREIFSAQASMSAHDGYRRRARRAL